MQNPLDKGLQFIRINPKSCFMQHPCEHNHTEIIARRDGVEYLECLDCRQIFEAEDLEPVTVEEEDEERWGRVPNALSVPRRPTGTPLSSSFCASLDSAVDLFPVSYLYHQDEESFVPNLIDGSVVLPRSNGDAIELLHRLHSMRTWILFQAEKVQVHLLADVSIELANVPLSGGRDFNAVGQALVPQYSHEFTERNGPLFFGFRQSGAGVFEVQAVHFLLGQALQKAEIVDGNDSGQVFPTAEDDGPLLPMGGAVYDFGKLLLRLRDIEACHLYDSTTSIEQERALCNAKRLTRLTPHPRCW